MEIENDRVLATLTVGEYKEVIGQVMDKRLKKKEEEHEYGFGLECIEKRYHVTKGTAQTYKNTFLKQAIMQHGNEWGIDNTLSGFIVQSEDISEETVTDVTQDQKGAVVSEMEYDKRWNLTLGVIGDSSATLPEVGDITFAYGGHKWKVDSVTYTGGYQDKKKYSIACHRNLNFPAQS